MASIRVHSRFSNAHPPTPTAPTLMVARRAAGCFPPPAVSASVSHPSSIRRTLAIISHPDAGKTTLTEKFLLYGGAIDLAGSVTTRRDRRQTTSDWMELEKQRGISISSTVNGVTPAGLTPREISRSAPISALKR